MVGLRVDEDRAARREVDVEEPHGVVLHPQAEGVPVEGACRVDVVDGEAAEGVRALEHCVTSRDVNTVNTVIG